MKNIKKMKMNLKINPVLIRCFDYTIKQAGAELCQAQGKFSLVGL